MLTSEYNFCSGKIFGLERDMICCMIIYSIYIGGLKNGL